MKITFQKETLLSAINTVLRAVPSKTTLPILQCILIDADLSEIRLIGNNTEMGIETIVEGSIYEHGKIALEARLFSEIIRYIPSQYSDILIQTDDKFQTRISCDNCIYNISGMDGELFPYIPYIEKNAYISLKQLTLKNAILQTAFSISPNDSNKLMSGELFEVKENCLMVASLDGHRISIRNIHLNDTYPDERVIVPGKTLNEVSKILNGDNDKEVQVYFTDKHILFEFDNTKILSRLIEGNYFRIETMISRNYETMVSVNRLRFMTILDQSMPLSKDNDKKPLVLRVNDECIEFSLKGKSGTMQDQIDIQKTGKDIMIGFNPKFLSDAVRAIDDETINLYMTDAISPCVIRDKDENYIYLILPINFNAY